MPRRLVLLLSVLSMLAVVQVAPTASALSLVLERQDTIDYAVPNGWLSVHKQSATFLVSGGHVPISAFAYGFSWFDMTGGSIEYTLRCYTQATCFVSGGSIGSDLEATSWADIHWSGGSVGGRLVANDGGNLFVYGTSFRVDGVPASPGVLPAGTGTLQVLRSDGWTAAVDYDHLAGPVNGGRIVLVAGAPPVETPPDLSHLTVILEDGQAHTIDDASWDDMPYGIHVLSPGGGATTLEISPGALIGNTLHVSDHSEVTMSGGDVGYRVPSASALFVTDQARFTMTGGTVFEFAHVERDAVLDVSAGSFLDALWIAYGATTTLTGGLFLGEIRVSLDSTLLVEGGFFTDDLVVDADATLRGGEWSRDLIVHWNGTVTLENGAFRLNGEVLPVGPINEETGILEGVFANGDEFAFYMTRTSAEVSPGLFEQGQVVVPEPGLAIVLPTACLSLALRSRSRTRRAA